MCYVLFLSTTSDEDLTVYNNDLVRFSSGFSGETEVAQLQHGYRWYIGSKSRCSCSFRHLHSIELGFGEPVDWYEEDQDDIEATLHVIRLIRSLVVRGHGVDCIDVWTGADRFADRARELEVDLSVVADAEFRFFENHYFSFTNAS